MKNIINLCNSVILNRWEKLNSRQKMEVDFIKWNFRNMSKTETEKAEKYLENILKKREIGG